MDEKKTVSVSVKKKKKSQLLNKSYINIKNDYHSSAYIKWRTGEGKILSLQPSKRIYLVLSQVISTELKRKVQSYALQKVA